jgi:prevent-host-death family protein
MATLPKSLPKPKNRSRAHIAKVALGRGTSTEKLVSASDAKTHLLKLLDTVDRTREGLVITKRGRPVAKLVPVDKKQPLDIFGCMKGTFRITGDIVGPEPDAWEAML